MASDAALAAPPVKAARRAAKAFPAALWRTRLPAENRPPHQEPAPIVVGPIRLL